MKKIFEGVVRFDSEDSGAALIAQIGETDCLPWGVDEPGNMFVRIQSWDDKKEHIEARHLEGKRVRVTVEEI